MAGAFGNKVQSGFQHLVMKVEEFARKANAAGNVVVNEDHRPVPGQRGIVLAKDVDVLAGAHHEEGREIHQQIAEGGDPALHLHILLREAMAAGTEGHQIFQHVGLFGAGEFAEGDEVMDVVGFTGFQQAAVLAGEVVTFARGGGDQAPVLAVVVLLHVPKTLSLHPGDGFIVQADPPGHSLQPRWGQVQWFAADYFLGVKLEFFEAGDGGGNGHLAQKLVRAKGCLAVH